MGALRLVSLDESPLIGRTVTVRVLRRGQEVDVELVPDELTD